MLPKWGDEMTNGPWIMRPTTFTDSTGDTWQAEVNAFTVDEALRETGIDLYDIVTSGGTSNIFEQIAKPRTLVAILYCVCQEQIEKRQLEPQDFAKRLASGEAIEGATEALINGIVNFFPPKKRHLLIQLLEKKDNLEARIAARGQELLNSGVMEQRLESALAEYDANFSAAVASSGLQPQDD